MTSFGVLPEGFVEKTLQTVLDEMEADEKAAFGAGTDVAVDAPLGQVNGIVGDQLAELWELGGAVYRALYPDSSEDESLDNVVSITGTTREKATNTLADLLLNLDPATTVVVGSIVRNSITGDRFATTAVATNAGADQTGVIVQARAEQTGPVPADAFAIDEIVTPLGGWTAQAAIDSGNAGPFNISFNDTLIVKIDNGTTQVLVFVATAAEIDSGNTETFALNDGETLNVKVDGAAADTATFNATAAALENANAETYALVDGQTLLIRVDGGGIQTVTFNTGEFVAIGAATAEEVRDVINAEATGLIASATSAGTKATLTSLKIGTGSGIEVTGGTANGALGFSTTPVVGTGDFVDISVATAAEVAVVITADITGASAAPVAGAVRITSATLGAASELEVTGGTANVALGFSITPVNGTQDFTNFASVPAADMAAAIDAKLAGGEAAGLTTNVVRAQSETDGPGSAIEVTGGTANAALGFSVTKVQGLNQLDATTVGRDLEADVELRLRRVEDLRAQGNATIEAIKSDVLEVVGVDEVFVFNNPGDTVDGDGLPPHSFEVVVKAPAATDAQIATAIFLSGGAGIGSFGSITEIVTDSQGFSQTIKFSRATEKTIFIDITVVTNTDPAVGPIYPVDGDEQVKTALVAKGNTLGIGDDVILEFIKCGAFDVPGVTDITVFEMDITAFPSATSNIPIGGREIADFDTSRIVVTS